MDNEDKMILTFYYLGKMCEGGLAESLGGVGALTADGFDMAMNLVESGAKLTEDDIKLVLSGTDVIDQSSIEWFTAIILELQERGYKEVMEMVAKLDGEIAVPTEIDEILSGYTWIKVKRYDERDVDSSNIEDAYNRLLDHHQKETNFLINKVRELAQIIKDGNTGSSAGAGL